MALWAVQFGCFAAIAIAVVGWQGLADRLGTPGTEVLRMDAVRASLAMIQHRPWLGSGLGTWARMYPRHAGLDTGVAVNQAHNDWAQWAAEGGLPFLVVMILFAGFYANRHSGRYMGWVWPRSCCMRSWITRCSSGPRWRRGGSPWLARCARVKRPRTAHMMTYYEELGVPAEASREQIRQAYKRLVRLLHPDQCGDPATRVLAELRDAAAQRNSGSAEPPGRARELRPLTGGEGSATAAPGHSR